MKTPALIEAIEQDFREKHPGFHKSRRAGLVTLVGVMLEVRTANLMELGEALPREIAAAEYGYQSLERLLKHEEIKPDVVIKPYALEVIERLTDKGQTVVVQMDPSHLNDTNEVLMLSVRVGNRAWPVSWDVKETQGNRGFSFQKERLDRVRGWLPESVPVMLGADRFYGTAARIKWCQEAGWGYRIRLKGNLTLTHEGGEITTGEVAKLIPGGLEGAWLYDSGVKTNLGILHEKGHKEPWMIARDTVPSRYTPLDYGLRWGIESMFSDFKSRGFGLMQSQIKLPERMERLILVMSIALYWAVSCGMFAQHQAAESGLKRGL
ncbi:MAG: transposase [Candidatus Competibacter sp.]|nr:transposase [Candidatus Competibacter sp.]MDG4604947.1 transposase [Candidatus Contendobacter sp.]HRD49093.1 transposase [Candidatus Contendobacter sp.]